MHKVSREWVPVVKGMTASPAAALPGPLQPEASMALLAPKHQGAEQFISEGELG